VRAAVGPGVGPAECIRRVVPNSSPGRTPGNRGDGSFYREPPPGGSNPPAPARGHSPSLRPLGPRRALSLAQAKPRGAARGARGRPQTGHPKGQDHERTHLMHPGRRAIRSDRFTNVTPDADGHGRQGKQRVPLQATEPWASAPSGARAVRSPATPEGGRSAGGGQPERRGSQGSSVGVRVVPRPDHAAVARADSEMVLGNVPAPGLGTVPGRRLRPQRHSHS
jgi:hypothetical protein